MRRNDPITARGRMGIQSMELEHLTTPRPRLDPSTSIEQLELAEALLGRGGAGHLEQCLEVFVGNIEEERTSLAAVLIDFMASLGHVRHVTARSL
ncbi:unnamed protein product [Symbiodinium sp. KB8]|nr:unnamed protein product [Symbiodinium sp. KB8]